MTSLGELMELALNVRASDLASALKARGVRTDVRSDVLRLGPAPCLSDRRLEAPTDALHESVT